LEALREIQRGESKGDANNNWGGGAKKGFGRKGNHRRADFSKGGNFSLKRSDKKKKKKRREKLLNLQEKEKKRGQHSLSLGKR